MKLCGLMLVATQAASTLLPPVDDSANSIARFNQLAGKYGAAAGQVSWLQRANK